MENEMETGVVPTAEKPGQRRCQNCQMTPGSLESSIQGLYSKPLNPKP